jgi:hypothetical protein
MLANVSPFTYEWDLWDIDLSKTPVESPCFYVQGNAICLGLVSSDTSIGVYVCGSCVEFPGAISYQFEVVDCSVKSEKVSRVFYGRDDPSKEWNWFGVGPETIRDHTLRVIIWIDISFSDYVDKPSSFKEVGRPFEKMWSNLSFRVGNEVIYVVRGAIESGCPYFRLGRRF